jgi:hypothetical protein
MDTKNVLLGVFVALTLVFASLTLEEYSRVTPTQTLTSTTTEITTFICPSGMVCGSFTYSPIGQVEVKSVEANYTTNQFGPAAVTFWVTFENVASYPVDFAAYALNASIAPNSSALREVFPPNSPPGITQGTSPLNNSQSYTLLSPYSGDNYEFLLVQPGTADVNFNFTTSSGTTVIAAQFTFQAPAQSP